MPTNQTRTQLNNAMQWKSERTFKESDKEGQLLRHSSYDEGGIVFYTWTIFFHSLYNPNPVPPPFICYGYLIVISNFFFIAIF